MRKPSPRILLLLAGGAVAVAVAGFFLARYARSETAPLLLRLAATPAGEARGARIFEVKKIEFLDEARGWRRGIASPLTLSAPPDATAAQERVLRLPYGTYREVRLEFGKRFDALEGEAPPVFSQVLTLPVALTLRKGTAAYLSLTLFTDASLRRTEDGEEVLVPMVAVEAREGIQLSKNNAVSGGTVTFNQTFGMTPSGGMRSHYRLPDGAVIVNQNGIYAVAVEEEKIIRRFQESLAAGEEAKSAPQQEEAARTPATPAEVAP